MYATTGEVSMVELVMGGVGRLAQAQAASSNDLAAFLRDHGLELVFGVTTVVLGLATLRYRRREHLALLRRIIGDERQVMLFLDREPMIDYLKTMYDAARPGEVIWGQCVGCQNYGFDVRSKTLAAAGRGVTIQFIVNIHAPTRDEFRSLYEPIKSAELKEAADSQLSVQGLGDREVVFSARGVTSYSGVLIRDAATVQIFREWFSRRFDALPDLDANASGPGT